MTGFEGVGDFDSTDPWQRHIAHQAAKGRTGEAKPYPKSAQLARKERRYHRQVAGPKRWQAIIAAKQGPCRVTGAAPPNEMAHLISRAQGGPDSEWNLVPLAREAHVLFDARDPDVCRKVCESLTDQEYAGLVEHAGENVFEARFGIRFERPA